MPGLGRKRLAIEKGIGRGLGCPPAGKSTEREVGDRTLHDEVEGQNRFSGSDHSVFFSHALVDEVRVRTRSVIDLVGQPETSPFEVEIAAGVGIDLGFVIEAGIEKRSFLESF